MGKKYNFTGEIYEDGKRIITSDQIPTKISDLTNDSGFISSYTETDPTVPAWAKASTKPKYTASEVGALPDTTVIPDALADLSSDATHRTVTDTEKSNWNAAKTHADSTHARTDATKVADSTTNGNILINGTETNVYTHPTSGVTAGTYKSVTVNTQGHITGGSNPTTLAGYGITDAESKGAANSALTSANEYTDSVAAGKSDTDHKHDTLYDTKGAADSALASAKEYTNTKTSGLASSTSVNTSISNHNSSSTAHSDIRTLIGELTTKLNAFLDVDDTTTDQLSEVLTLIENNKGTLESLTTSKINVSDIVNDLTTNNTTKVLSAAQGVAIKSLIDALESELDDHNHVIADVSGLQSALDGKAASSHGTHVSYSTTNPVMDGTATVGTASTVARSDHKHPTDTSRASKSEFDTHDGNTTKHITAAERTNWGSAYTHSQAAHAPSNAEKNQNAFSNVAVSGQTTVAADSATDTLTLVAGDNVTITTDASNDKVTITAKDTVYTHPESHAASMITGLATVATSGNYSDLSGTPTIPTGAAADKGVDTSITAGSTSTNLPTSKAVAAFVEGKGYKTTDNNTTYTVATGDSNGQIKVTPSSGNAYNVDVKGLDSAAYTASTAYATAAQGTKADNAVPNSRTVNGKALSANISLTASDVGALSSTTVLADLSSDATHRTVTDTEKSNWNAAKTHADSTHARTDATKVADSTTNGNILINGTETNVYTHPTSGVTAGTYKSVTVNTQGHITGGSNPTTLAGYGITDAETKGSANSALTSAKEYTNTNISSHNSSTTAHTDIRELLTELGAKINNFLDVDDATTDQLSEVLALIEANSSAIESLTTSKVNTSDIAYNLTSTDTSKVLSASQGAVLKKLIDCLDEDFYGHMHSISEVKTLQTTLDGKSDSDHDHDDEYDVIGSANSALTSAKEYTNTKTSGLASETYVDNKVAGIVDTAPEALNTLNELAAALGDDPNFATTVSTEIGKKVDKTTTVNGHALSGNVTVTKTDVGLGNVPNVATNDQTPTFTQASTLANIASGEKVSTIFGKIMKAIADVISHIANKNNPHGVTKAQVGLGNVENKSSADILGELTKTNVTDALGYTPATAAQGTKADNALPKSGGSITGNLSVDGTINGMTVTYDSNAKKFTFS